MNKLTDIELEFLRKEASKLDGIFYLKSIITHFWSKIPMPGTVDDLGNFEEKDKKKYINDHKKWTQTFKKALKVVGEVKIEILEEGTYETGKREVKKEYGVKTSIFSKEAKEEDQIFIDKTFKGGVYYHLTFQIENTLIRRLQEYRELSKKKPLLFKSSGHLKDQMLKTTPKGSNLLDLFSELEEDTKMELEIEKIEISRELFSGINLTASEMKLQDVFSILLFQQSQTEYPNKPNYYKGIEGKKQSSYLGEKGAIAPTIQFSLYTITKEFTGGKTPSGKDEENVKKILQKLEKKKFLIKHTETYTNKKNQNKTIIEREGLRPLFHLDKITLTEEDKNGKQTNKSETMVVVLSPLYSEQIETKFILQPINIIQQLAIANGSPDIPTATYRLKDYLYSIIAGNPKDNEHKITARKLYEKLEPKLMERPKLKEAKENTIRAIETLIKVGVIEKYELGTSKVGDPMYTFYLNKNSL